MKIAELLNESNPLMTPEQEAKFKELKAQSPIFQKINAYYDKVQKSYGFPETILADLSAMFEEGEKNTQSTIPVAKHLGLDPNTMWDANEDWWTEGVDERLEALYNEVSAKINNPKINDMFHKETSRLVQLVAKNS